MSFMTKPGVYKMAKKQPKKAVKIEELEASTTVDSVVESVTDEATEHSARVGYMLTLQRALRAITETQSTSVLLIVRTLLFGSWHLDTDGNVVTEGGIRELVNIPNATDAQRIDVIGSVVCKFYRQWTNALKKQAESDNEPASGYVNIAETMRTPLNVLAITFIWGNEDQIARVVQLANPSNDKGKDTSLQDVRRLAGKLLDEYAQDGRVTNGTYKDSNKQEQDYSLEGLLEDFEDIAKAMQILADTLATGGLEDRYKACMKDARNQVRNQLSTLIPDGRKKDNSSATFKKSSAVENELGSSQMNDARNAINTTLQSQASA